MTLLGLPLTQLLAIFAAAATAVTLLYILRLRRRRVMVPFTALWNQVLQQRKSRAWWRRLRRLLSLLAQLLFILLLVSSLGDPHLSERFLAGRHIVLLLDTSASMNATDAAEGTRMAAALAAARQVVRGMRGRDELMVVLMDHRVAPLTTFSGDVKSLLAALSAVGAAETPADLPRALRFCADALRDRRDPLLILVGDGTYDPALLQAALQRHAPVKSASATDARPTGSEANIAPLFDGRSGTPIEFRFLPVGQGSDNVGIVAFSARRDPVDKGSLALLLELANYRKRPASLDVHLIADGSLVEVQRLDLAPGQHARYACDSRSGSDNAASTWCNIRAAGQVLQVRLVPRQVDTSAEPFVPPDSSSALDALSVDDRAFAVVPPRRVMRVLLATRGNLFLEGALLLLDNVALRRVEPEKLTSELIRKHDAVILDGCGLPGDAPPTNTLWVAPPAGTPFAGTGTVTDPLITDQNTDHPVMRNITLKDVNMIEARRLTRSKGDVVLAGSFRRPLILARQESSRRQVVVGFDVKQSDLPLRIAFPLLLANTLDWFADEGEARGVATYRVGETWQVPLPPDRLPATHDSATLVDPAGEKTIVPIRRGRAIVHGQRVGVYELRRAGTSLRIAANLANAEESDIRPRARKLMQQHLFHPPSRLRTILRRDLWIYLIVAAIALLALEWFTYNRRITV